MYDDFFAKAHELVQKGVPFVTATVVWAEKPSSGKPGDKAIITIDGVMHGWIGGSCAQPTVIKEALKALEADEAKLIRLSTEPENKNPRSGLVDLPMTCFSGGTLEIYLEPQPPRPRLLIVGTLPVARALSQLARAMNYHVIVVDLDAQGEQLPFADETLNSLDGIASQIRPFTYIVIATHGNYDELALEQILKAKPSYVGLVASLKRAEAVRDYLKGQGLTDIDMLPLKAPAGLDIQARRGDEIALSIMAEIVQKRRNAELLDLALFHQGESAEADEHDHHHHDHLDHEHHIHEHHDHENRHENLIQIQMAGPQSTETAVDPICGMEVVIATARYTYEHEGQITYFCCAGCREKFVEMSRQVN
jgi:xanthine dehydrogenase accessory factor